MAEGISASLEHRRPALAETGYTGRFEGARVEQEEGRLVFRRDGRAALRMVALGGNDFTLVEDPAARLTFTVENGVATGFDFARAGGPVVSLYPRAK